MRRKYIWPTIVLSVGALAACSSHAPQPREKPESSPAWPMYQYASGNNAVLPGDNFGAQRWVVQAGGKINGGLSIAGGTLYFTSFDHHVYAVGLKSGRIRWRTNIGGVTMTTPVVARGIVVAGTGTNAVLVDNATNVVWGRSGGDDVVALDADTGAVRWKYHTVGEDMPSAAIYRPHSAHPSVIFSNGDGHIRSLDLASGKLLWSNHIKGVATMSSADIQGNVVYGIQNFSIGYIFAHQNNPEKLRRATWAWAVNAANGKTLWKSHHGNSDCSVVVADGHVFLAADMLVHPISTGDTTSYSRVFALNAKTGNLTWHYASAPGPRENRGTNENAIAGMYYRGTFYESLPFAHRLAAFDAATGHVRWMAPTKAAVKMSAVTDGHHLFFGDNAGYFYVVNLSNGKEIRRMKFPSFFTSSPPVIFGKTLFVANNEHVYAIPVEALVRGSFKIH